MRDRFTLPSGFLEPLNPSLSKKRSKLQRMKRKMCIYQQKLGISLSTSSQLSSSAFFLTEFKPLLQKYVLGSTLGKGAYGEVRRAKRKADSIDVAVKISFLNDTDMLEEPNQKEELPAEVVLLKRVCASPACPSIIQMLDYVITPTYVIIVLQLLKSCMDLCQFLYKKKRVLGEEKVRLAFRQIVGAFLHCHTRGVLHNDIKLENILYQPGTGRIKLIDFGYGDILHDHDYTYPPGALQYQPPEWIVYSRYRAEPCTVWALGVVLFELLHGFLPFQEEHQIVLCELDCFSSISEGSEDLIRKCLCPEPSDRLTLYGIWMHPWLRTNSNHYSNV
ncbi:serine/threonine-protein kinase pim-2-like [Polypterus senegalus]|uniref:serine/threonine-protein kinase pim-2-like n=1 Tax=Polypterus senegalus TaxID=55291 RepID=UPI0019638230|nr:serine/threonine-protein kinase pim-2-like [Polypterus senegalus]